MAAAKTGSANDSTEEFFSTVPAPILPSNAIPTAFGLSAAIADDSSTTASMVATSEGSTLEVFEAGCFHEHPYGDTVKQGWMDVGEPMWCVVEPGVFLGFKSPKRKLQIFGFALFSCSITLNATRNSISFTVIDGGNDEIECVANGEEVSNWLTAVQFSLTSLRFELCNLTQMARIESAQKKDSERKSIQKRFDEFLKSPKTFPQNESGEEMVLMSSDLFQLPMDHPMFEENTERDIDKLTQIADDLESKTLAKMQEIARHMIPVFGATRCELFFAKFFGKKLTIWQKQAIAEVSEESSAVGLRTDDSPEMDAASVLEAATAMFQ